MMIPLCVGGRRMCVNYFTVFAQALEEFPPFFFWHQKRQISGTYTTRMRTVYYFLQHYF